jgi:Protein of unknown function (DUF499)
MATLQPWYKVVTPREDLREGKPLDAAEFAVHLDQVRDRRGSEEYFNPTRFFERTFLTKNLGEVAGQVVRRLSGERTATSAVFNMATQFGGGKTHALTLLYHLATHGPEAKKWVGVDQILEKAEVAEVPKAVTAVFVGTEFDSIKGRGGDDGTPLRKTPWGEIAFQLGGEAGFGFVADHDKELISPAGDVIRQFLSADRPSLILVDELLNYVSRNRKSGLSSQLYSFVQNLAEEARARENVVLVVSIPASELEMTAEDQSDYERFKKLLDRVGKAVVMSAESETSEIIRRRLFEWDSRAVTASGKVLLPQGASDTVKEYAGWLSENRAQFPAWFKADHARETFEATYPFHPAVLSVFERKWQELPRFQQTRGVLRLLAMWVSQAYLQGFKGADKDPLIGLGTAPLNDPFFRSAVFEQLGETKLEGAVTTDIAGKNDSHAIRLDEEAVDTIKKARLHQKVATSIFFESNGGQTKSEATVPEIRLAVAGPDSDLGNVETALEALTEACYYLTSERNRYSFGLKENLNKRYADRRASVSPYIDARVKEEIQRVFPTTEGIDRKFFPEQSAQIPDVPALSLVIAGPDHSVQDDVEVRSKIESMIKEHGKVARTFKSALVWVVPEASAPMREEARKLLAWEDIRDEGLKLDDVQQKQLEGNIQKAARDLKESVWRSYKNVLLLGKDNALQTIDLGLVTSSAAETLPKHIVSQLRQSGEVEKEVSPRFLVRNWPPAFTEWSTKSVRDAFYASPQFPRLLDSEAIRNAVARGVTEGHLAYVGKKPKGGYEPFVFKTPLDAADVEISDDVYILTAEEAERHVSPAELVGLVVMPTQAQLKPGAKQAFNVEGVDQYGNNIETGPIAWTATGGTIGSDGVFEASSDEGSFLVTATADGKSATASVTLAKVPLPPKPAQASKLLWSGEVVPQKWSQLYMKVLTKLVSGGDVRLKVDIEATLKDGATDQRLEETKAALRELGLSDDVRAE